MLIVVGVLMMANVREIDWLDFETAMPAFLTIACMPFAYSIADGIAAGFLFYTLIKLFRGKAKEVHPILYVLCVLFVLRFIIVMVNKKAPLPDQEGRFLFRQGQKKVGKLIPCRS